MKNLNLIKRLWTDSHEKQKVRGMQKYCILLLLLFTCVTHAWASEYAGGAVYFDNSVTNWSYTHVYLIIGKNDWSTTYQMEPMTGTSYYHVSLPKGGWSDATYIAVAAKNGSQEAENWSDINSKFTKYSTKKSQSGGLSQATYILTPSSSSNGFSFTLSSSTSIFSSCPTDVLNGSKIMVYAGEAWSWDQGFYRFMSSNNTSNTVATAAIRGIKKNLTNIGEVGFGPALLASGTYYQGHWASGLSKSISAGKAYMVYSAGNGTNIGNVLATTGDNKNSLYDVTKVNTTPTTSVTTTIGSSSFAEGTSSLSVSTGSAGKSVMNSTNTVEYYLYNGSTWSKVTVSAGSLNVSSLEKGSYKLATVLYDGYIYVKADEDEFEVIEATGHTITYTPQSTGWTYGTKPTAAEKDATVTFQVIPTDGYTVTVSSSDVELSDPNEDNEYTFTMPDKDVSINVSATENTYTVTLVNATESSVSAGCGTGHSITAASAPFGMGFDHWEVVSGTASFTNQNASTTTVKASTDATVKAVFAQKLYAYIEGRFHVADASSPRNWTNTFGEGNWDQNSTRIPFSYDATRHVFYLHTYAKASELSTQISNFDPYFYIKTSSSSSSASDGSATIKSYKCNSSGTVISTVGYDNKIQFDYIHNNTTDTKNANLRFNSSDVTAYITIFFDGTYIWYEYMPAIINTINLSGTRVPPMAEITATPSMSYKGATDKAYCWAVYSDEECTSKVNSVTFSSLGDGKVQFMAPQTRGTYYLKLIVHSTDDCNATIDDEKVVSFTVTTDDMVFFKNVPGWGNVHVYFLGTSDYWDDNLGSGCAGRDNGAAHGMTRIGNSDVYYYDYHGNSNVVFDGDGKAYIAFTDNYKPNSNNFSECQAVYRGDFSTCAAMFVPENWITHYLNNAAYYNRGYWTNYMSTSSGFSFYLWDKTANDAPGEIKIVDGAALTGTIGNNTYVYEYDFANENNHKNNLPYTYGFKVAGCGGSWYGAGDDMTIAKCTDWQLGTDTRKCGISVNAPLPHKFIFTLAGDGHVQVSVEYPVNEGDYRLLYNDNTQDHPHPSQYIRKRANGKDTVAMFIRPSATENLKVQYCTGIDGETITWANYNWTGSDATGAIDVSSLEDGVYVFYLVQDASGNLTVNTSETKPYLGKYYIRTSCVDGGWNSYKSTSDNLMTYAQYPEEKGYGFNYYKAKWVGTTGTDVTYTIACDFSPALCDTLVADEGNNPLSVPEARSLPHAANIRFGWHSKTNKMTRAYINGSTNVSDRFLVMIGDEKLKDKDGNALSISGLNANEISFSDLNNWIYRCDITAVEGAAVKLTANYDSHVQYFIGTSEKPEEILGGTGSKEYLMRVTYDFKTNRLMTAWLPNGNQITGDVELKADMMLIREGQNAATQVYFNGNNHKITEVKTIFGVMEFQYDHIAGQFPSWSSPNAYKYLMYYISFPFDVKVSEIFGAGVRGENWIIQKYNGARRAQIGWFAETPTFWETLPGDSTLHANEGYLLLLDRISFNDPSSSIWYKQGSGNSVYLYFPSVSNSIGTIKDANEEVTIKIPSHKCTIERPFTPDIDGWSGGKLVHSNTDSHWNVFGIPLFQSKAATTVGDSELKYFYSWNYTDNTLRPQVTLAGDTVFKSMHGYMVQFAGDVTFTGAHISASVAARRMPSNKHYLAELQLVNENGDENATYVELRENANTDFQLNEDMYMMRSSNTVDLYSFAGAYDVAANVLPIDDQLVRVGVDVKRAGTYRFTMPSEFSGTVTLIDNLMGTRTNMALGDHEVYLERGVDNNRFQLEINIQSSTTSLEGNDVKDGGAHKFIENGQMYILQNGVIYDARGNRVQ